MNEEIICAVFFFFDIVCVVSCFFFFFQAEDGIRDGRVTGVQTCALPISVARGGRTLFERAYTWAEDGYPMSQPSSPFRLASVSKAFTAALVYELAQAGALNLDTPVFPALGLDRPALPTQRIDPRLGAINVRRLIDHTGGWDAQAARFDPVFRMRYVARKLG